MRPVLGATIFSCLSICADSDSRDSRSSRNSREPRGARPQSIAVLFYFQKLRNGRSLASSWIEHDMARRSRCNKGGTTMSAQLYAVATPIYSRNGRIELRAQDELQN